MNESDKENINNEDLPESTEEAVAEEESKDKDSSDNESK